MTTRLHCPTCRRLLAVRQSDGSLEIRHGRRATVTVLDGSVRCVPCGCEVEVRRPSGPATLRALVR